MALHVTLADGLSIRNAAEADAPIIYEFLCLLEETPLDPSAFNAVFRENLMDSSVHYQVAERAGEVVGFVSCHVQRLLHHVGKVGEIQELFVRPNVRHQQIGQRLIEALIELAIQEGFVNLEVTTNQKRLDTIRFYERESFRRTHVKLVRPIQADDRNVHENT